MGVVGADVDFAPSICLPDADAFRRVSIPEFEAMAVDDPNTLLVGDRVQVFHGARYWPAIAVPFPNIGNPNVFRSMMETAEPGDRVVSFFFFATPWLDPGS